MALNTTHYPSAAWELPLHKRAYTALGSYARPAGSRISNRQTLDQAYRRCNDLTRQHSKSFYMASGLLPAEKRRAVRALYAFCRVADDIVDGPSANAGAELNRWQKMTLSSHPLNSEPVAVAWADARREFGIPRLYAEQLLDGVRQDLRPVRYETFDELTVYAYGVASTVGLMSMHIIGYSGREAVPYAIKLGVALQLTNILRDVGEDLRNGRIYLPRAELRQFGLSEEDLAQGVIDERWRAFMRFQIERNRQLYAEALPGIAMLHHSGRLAIAAAAEFYAAILEDIEAHDYDVFTRRAHIGALEKLRRLPGLWQRVKNV